MNRRMLVISCFLGALPRVAAAQDAAATSSAREAAKSGIADYYAGRYEAAQDKLARAFAVVPVPTLALFHARALVKTGKLVEASEVYLAATKLKTGDGDAETQEQARNDAKLERAALLKRIPRLHIAIAGAPPNQVTVVANGTNIPPSLYATGWMINPGALRVTALYGAQRLEATEQFREGEEKTVNLTFKSAAALAPPEVVAPARPNQPMSDNTTTQPSSAYRIATWASLGVGAAGLLLGSTTGLVAIAKKQDLDRSSECEGSRCVGGAVGSDVDSYNLMRHLSTTGFIVAAVGGTAGALLYFNAPKPNQARNARPAWRFNGWIGVTSAGIGGTFQ